MTFRGKVKRLVYTQLGVNPSRRELDLAYKNAYETLAERQRLRRENRAARKQGEATGTTRE